MASRKDARRLCRARRQTLAYVYSRATETDAMQAKVLTDDEARRVAVPELLGHKGMKGPQNVVMSVVVKGFGRSESLPAHSPLTGRGRVVFRTMLPDLWR